MDRDKFIFGLISAFLVFTCLVILYFSVHVSSEIVSTVIGFVFGSWAMVISGYFNK